MTTTTLSRPVVDTPSIEESILPGRRGRPAWERPALVALLVGTAALYLWGLGASGWANSFYSAAVQAGTKSWKAFFFGSSDSSNFITIDKPPAALWVMELSARAFGVNSWSILVPQALEGVAAVGLLYASVRRWFGASAGLLAGTVLALTPVAALMFRFNNPDALLVLMLVAAAYAFVRALEAGRTWWLVLAATLIGFGFITKMFQALLVVPAFALVYLFAGPPALGRRIVQLLAAGAALAVSSLWWVVAVELVPASSRPYIGGSTNNSLWNLIFGYNGFGRLTGNETGSVGGGGTTGGRWGVTGFFRLLNSQFGGQVAWLLPAALVLGVASLMITWRMPRTNRTRSAVLLWGGWLAVTSAVFSFGRGIIHPYYTVALAPAIGALVGIGAVAMWRRRSTWPARAVLSGTIALTAVWSYILLDRSPSWYPSLRYIELSAGLAVAVLMLTWIHVSRRVSAVVAAAAILVALAGPAAYTLSTIVTPHSGAIPSAGPTVVGAFGGPGGGRRPFVGNGGPPPFAGGAPRFGGGFAGGAPGGRGGGLLNGSTPSASVTAALQQNSSHYTWVAATVGSNEASGYQLASGKPIMAIGGFNGTDPTPTLAQFEQYVQQGKIHYFIVGGRGGGPGGGGPGGGAPGGDGPTSWVETHFKSVPSLSTGSTVIYDLTQPVTAG